MVVAQGHQPEESNMEYFTVGNSIIYYDELFDELLAVTSQHIDMNPKYISPVHFGVAVVPVVNGMVEDDVIPPYYKDEVLYKVWDYVFYLSDTSSL
jgi:hypothetical protein